VKESRSPLIPAPEGIQFFLRKMIGPSRILGVPGEHKRLTHSVSQAQQTALLFDHLVGDGEDARRDGELKRLGGIQGDHEFEFSGPQDGQIRWLAPLRMRPA
jgi:hypothetical protein